MNHLIRIERKTQTQDTVTGVITETWATFKNDVPCDIVALSVKDFIQSQADQSEIQARITIPYISGLDATMRIVGLCGCHENRIYNPRGILEDDITSREYITLPCAYGTNEG